MFININNNINNNSIFLLMKIIFFKFFALYINFIYIKNN